MSRHKEQFYAVAKGKFLALGYPGQFGFKDGALTKMVDDIKDATIYAGKRGHKQINQLVDQMMAAMQSLSKSVIYDWPALGELRQLGVISVHKIEVPKKEPKRKRLKLV